MPYGISCELYGICPQMLMSRVPEFGICPQRLMPRVPERTGMRTMKGEGLIFTVMNKSITPEPVGVAWLQFFGNW
jgi:hypothetical protein